MEDVKSPPISPNEEQGIGRWWVSGQQQEVLFQRTSSYMVEILSTRCSEQKSGQDFQRVLDNGKEPIQPY